jgi:hypothetical protein
MSIVQNILETEIYVESLYRDTLIEQCRAVYPALKYKDTDILHESLSITKNITCSFFRNYKAYLNAQFDRAIAELINKNAEYNSVCKKFSNSIPTAPPVVDRITVFTHNINIPNFEPIIDKIRKIPEDYRKCVNDEEFIKANMDKMKKLNKSVVKKICDVSNDEEPPSNVTYYTYNMLRNDGKKETVSKDKIYYETKIMGKYNEFVNLIKILKSDIYKYMSIIHSIIVAFDKNIQVQYITSSGEYEVDLSTVDPESLFFRYELSHMSTMLSAATSILFERISAISADIDFRINELYEGYQSDVIRIRE